MRFKQMKTVKKVIALLSLYIKDNSLIYKQDGKIYLSVGILPSIKAHYGK